MKNTFPLALTFLTKVPWPWRGEAAPEDLARSMLWFPWVGALLGAAFAGAWWGLSLLLPGPAAAALLLVLTVLSTGALHLDGLADTADGLGGGHTPADRLRIMKDSRVGAFGVISLVLALLVKFAFFLALASKGPALWPVFLFPVVSRWGMTLLAFLAPYARPEGGLGQAMTQGLDRGTLAGSTTGALVLAVAAAGAHGLVLLLAAGVAVWLASHYFKRLLGGVTGDLLGAINEVLEILVLGGALVLL
jgi:adenosylcobinamide-GDP ribazoletransferase